DIRRGHGMPGPHQISVGAMACLARQNVVVQGCVGFGTGLTRIAFLSRWKFRRIYHFAASERT
ncbi:hypothetical protein QLG07_23160, partial [Erwinia sp. V90_4]|uniref:hypothetical protein n=1 Tax=Erwinia sp. V90_4 TaxID=3044239 RepID=UPI00249E7F22